MKNKVHNGLCRLLAMVLVLTFIVGLIPASVFAAQKSQIVIDQGYAMAGGTVSLDVEIVNNPGVSNALMTLTFHEDLELLSVQRGDAFSSLYFTKPAKLVSPCNFLWDALDEEDHEDGTLLTLNFKVKETATPGTICNVNLSYTDGDITNSQDEDVTIEMVGGTIEVLDYTPGDVNGDGTINGVDVSTLRKYIVGDPVDVNPKSGDVNGDGRVNGVDVVILRRQIAGGYDVELKPGKDICEHEGLKAVTALAATCTADGYTAHWFCTDCGCYYKDEYAQEMTSLSAVNISAIGHTEVIDKAVAPTYDTTGLTEGVHCKTCNTVIKAQETVEKLQATYHSITYMELYGAENPTPDRYAEHTGLLELPVPERAGYAFLGWYTSTDGDEVVDYIPAGSTENYVLFALWEKEVYDIYYLDVPDNTNPETYTVTDEFNLTEPRWSGLIFTGWTDQYGNTVTKIHKGTTGDLELTANWKRMRNIATPGNTKGLLMTYDPDAERYYFIYELGTIEHVVLEEISIGSSNLKYNSGATDVTFGLSETITISDGVADSIASTVSEAISTSHEWERAQEWGKETSNAHEVSVSASAEFGIGPVTTTIETEYGYTNTQTESWGNSKAESGSVEIGGEKTKTSASSVSYMKTIESSVDKEIVISKDMPVGYYSYVHAGNVRVFGIVTYDPGENTFFLDTYSILDNMHEMMLYYRDVNELNDQSTETLDYSIPRDRILSIVDSSYFIAYDGNTSDSGNMIMSVHKAGDKVTLAANEYEKPGYTFAGWEAPNGETFYADCAELDSLGATGEIITLKARWRQNNYSIVYNDNTPTHASTTVTGMPESTACVYDENVTLPGAPTLEGWTFEGWYSDPECTQLLGYADETLEKANLTTEANSVINAYAKWTSFDVYVTLDAGDGLVDGASAKGIIIPFNDNYGQLPVPTYTDHIFMGWYLDDQKIEADTQLVNSANHKLTAQWLRVRTWTQYNHYYGWYNPDDYELPDERKRITDDDGVYDYAHCSMDLEALKAKGYTRFKIVVEFQACESSDGYLDLWVCDQDKNQIQNYVTDELRNTHKFHWLTAEFVISIDQIGNGNHFYIEYGAHGDNSDDWLLGGAKIVIEAIK